MANRDQATKNKLLRRVRAFLVRFRYAARSNRQALQVQQPDPSRPAPLGAETQGNESRRGIRQMLDGWERRIRGIISVGATTSATNMEPEHQEECNFCGENFPLSSLGNLRCEHYICDNCLIEYFQISLDHVWLFPPRCCNRPIHLSLQVAEVLPADLMERFSQRMDDVAAERSEQNPTYCHVPRCSAGITRSNIIGNKAACPKCEALTCANCKEKYHDNGVCTKKGGFQVPEVDDIAAREGWKRCPSCHQMIQRINGCSGMSQLTSSSIKRRDSTC